MRYRSVYSSWIDYTFVSEVGALGAEEGPFFPWLSISLNAMTPPIVPQTNPMIMDNTKPKPSISAVNEDRSSPMAESDSIASGSSSADEIELEFTTMTTVLIKP